MTSERRKKLEETMKKFNKNQKDSILDFGTSHEDLTSLPTGIKSIDDFKGGGSKRGGFDVVYGGYSAGKSTLILQQIGTLQKRGFICCYIDLEHSFEKPRAKALGVNLEELVLAENCTNAEQALEIIRALCKEKAVDYFAIDSVQAMSPLNEQENKGKERQLVEKEIAELARTLGKFFRVVAPDVFNAKASVVMIGQIRTQGIGTFFTRAGLSGGQALLHWANQITFMRQGQGNDAPTDSVKKYLYDKDGKLRYKTEKKKIGFDAVLKLEKTKSSDSATEGSDIHVPFVFAKGFVDKVEQKEVEIEVSGTDEEKEQITAELILKGIIPGKVIKDEKMNTEKDLDDVKVEPGKMETLEIGAKLIPDKKERTVRADPKNSKITKEDAKASAKLIPKKRGRGRPKKEKHDN